jgi:hypothetical protein
MWLISAVVSTEVATRRSWRLVYLVQNSKSCIETTVMKMVYLYMEA